MNKEDFVRRCVSGGYCSKKVAEEYCKDRVELSENDIEEVWRKNERLLALKNNQIESGIFRRYEGEKSTRHLSYNGRLGRDN